MSDKTRQQDREEWVQQNACQFCKKKYHHSCGGFSCEDAIKLAEQQYERMRNAT